jgi:hypothetical protein
LQETVKEAQRSPVAMAARCPLVAKQPVDSVRCSEALQERAGGLTGPQRREWRYHGSGAVAGGTSHCTGEPISSSTPSPPPLSAPRPPTATGSSAPRSASLKPHMVSPARPLPQPPPARWP